MPSAAKGIGYCHGGGLIAQAGMYHLCCNGAQGDAVAQVVDDYSSKGYRLLAMAMGTLPKLDEADLPGLSQQQLEMQCSQIELLALVVLTNHVRPDSRDTITQLQDG